MGLQEKIMEILCFPPEGRSRELWRGMEIKEAVITYSSKGEVNLTIYDVNYNKLPSQRLFDFKEVLAEISALKQQIQEFEPNDDTVIEDCDDTDNVYISRKEVLALLNGDKEEKELPK